MKNLCLSLLLVLVLLGCDRFQYREQYVGEFDFTTLRTLPDSLDQDSTTTTFAGNVSLWDKDGLLLNFKADDSIAPTIAEDGTLSVPGFIASGGSFSGKFSSIDSVGFTAEFISYLREKVRLVVTGTRR